MAILTLSVAVTHMNHQLGIHKFSDAIKNYQEQWVERVFLLG